MKKIGIFVLVAAFILSLSPAFTYAKDKDDSDADYYENLSSTLQIQKASLASQLVASQAQATAYGKILKNSDPVLRILSPKANTKIISGSTISLRWQGINLSSSTIDAELVNKLNPSIIIPLQSGMDNDGQSEVIVPNIVTGGQYQVRLRATSIPTVTSTMRGYVTLSATVVTDRSIGAINLSAASAPQGGNINIAFNVSGATKKVDIYLLRYSEANKQQLIKDNLTVPSTLSIATMQGNFNYVIPRSLALGNDYYFKVVDNQYPSVVSTSTAFTVGNQSIAITTQPQSVGVGSKTQFAWTTLGYTPYVYIKLYKGTELVRTFPNQRNDGKFDFIVPTQNFAAATNYHFVVSNSYDSTATATTSDFAVTTSRGFVSASLSSASTVLGGSLKVYWATSLINSVKVDLYQYGLFNRTIASNVPVSQGEAGYNITLSRSEGVGTYKLRLSDAYNPSVATTTSEFQVGNSVVGVTSPIGGEVYQPGNVVPITWNTNGRVGYINVQIAGAGATTTIKTTTANDGRFNWTIPTGFRLGNDFKVILQDVYNPAIIDASDAPFQIKFTDNRDVSALTVGSATVNRGDTETVNWTVAGNISSVRLSVRRGNIEVYSRILPTPSGTAARPMSHSFVVTANSTFEPGAYTVTVANNANQNIIESANFTVTGQAFTITSQPASVVNLQNIVSTSWTNSGVLPRVRVRIVREGVVNDLYSTVVNNGPEGKGSSFSYVIPRDFSLGASTKIVVEDVSSATTFGVTSLFTITSSRSIASVSVSPSVLTRGSTYAQLNWIPTQSTQFYIQLLKDGTPVHQTSTNGLTTAAGLQGLIKINTRSKFAANESGLSYKADLQLVPSTNYSIRVFDADNLSVSGISPAFEIR